MSKSKSRTFSSNFGSRFRVGIFAALSCAAISFVAFVALAFGAQSAFAAACCGGGLPVPALILGDEQSNFSGSLTLSEIGTDVTADGVWKDRTNKESAQNLRFDGARIFNDRYQYGVSVPVLRRKREGSNESTGLGDVAFNGGYEFLTDWDYHPIQPKGVGFIQLVLPTGKSIQEATTLDQVDSRGRGFWALGIGTAFTKVRAPYDAILIFDVHRSFKKDSVSSTAGEINLKPGYGGTLSAGAGYTYGSWRFGGAASWVYEDAVAVSGAIQATGDIVRYAVATVSAVYSPNDDYTASLSYSDQTRLGEPTNTALAKSVQVSVQRRWAR